MKKLTTLAILWLCSPLLANEGNISVDLNSGKDIYSQCIDETIKEDPEANINNAVVSYCIDSTSEQYKKQINQLYQEITKQIKQSSDLNEVNYDLKGVETFQKTWIRYRNSKCALVDPGLGEHYCLMSENRMRVEKLKKIKAGKEQFYSDEDFE